MRNITERNNDTRIGKVVPPFKITLAVQCNRCGSVRYVNQTDVEVEQIVGSLQAGVDTWKDHGESEHSCDRRKRKVRDEIKALL